MRIRVLSLMIAFLLVGNSLGLIVAKASDTIGASDFQQGSWSKSIDLLDYARKYANSTGGVMPPAGWSSDTIVNYVNQNGFKLLYLGFAGVDNGNAKFTLPLQSIVESFNTTKGEPAMTDSSFLMLMAFNDTKTSMYPGSPDKGDNLWASFSMGSDYSAVLPAGKTPKLVSSVVTTPLKASGNEYTWGMTYKDLAAIWWGVAGSVPKLLPAALCVYDELGFNYRLVLNSGDGTAKLYMTYTIGEMRDLWTLGHVGLLPVIMHYNDTGTYGPLGKAVGSETVHGFLERNKISMSIVMSQRTWVADKEVSNKVNGSSVSDGAEVSSGSVQSTTIDGQKVSEVSFGEKKTYRLEEASGEKTYDAVTRIEDVNYYARNPILRIQNSLLFFSNSLMAHLFPAKYAETAKVWMNATKSDYLFATSYPTYSGYQVIHDPVYTAYTPPKSTAGGAVPVPSLAVLVGVVVAVIFLAKRRS